MKVRLSFLFTVLLCCFCIPVFSQSSKPVIAKEPTWVTKNTTDYSSTSLDKQAGDGYIDISYEEQVSLADQSTYRRRSRKIISQAGVQNGSEISISFDPSYQQLSFHSIHIIRDGEILNRLDLSKIKTVHQEEELANFIYNGTLNAILILDDVRKGDIIEYSYTIKGFNPIFKNKFADDYNMQFSMPMYNLYYKIIVPKGRNINIKDLNDTSIHPVISNSNGQQVYEWRRSNIKPMILQDFAPDWYDPYPQFMVSEFNSWKEVNDWAKQLFPYKRALSPALQKKIKEIETAHPDNDARVATALRFVQDDIRYMGIEMGEHSHLPADPSKVFAQRFGDCKEKSYLLCCMLTAMGIEANVVLINTENKNMFAQLPAPTDFDHATVRAKLDSAYYFFDATIDCQRGDIKNIFYPDYQAGFVITDTSTGLTPIRFRDVSYQHISEFFTVAGMTGGGTLLVTTDFHGSDADVIRDDFNNRSNTDILTDDQKFYAKYFQDIIADSLTYDDNDSTGVFTTTEYYTIPSFWTIDKDSVRKFSFSPFAIDNTLCRPKEKDRKMPFSLDYPSKFQEEITVNLPEAWNVTASQTHLKNAGFGYNSNFYGQDNQVHLNVDYENYKNNVTAAEATAYFKDLNQYDETENFDVSSNPGDSTTDHTTTGSNANLAIILFIIGFIIAGIVWWSQRK